MVTEFYPQHDKGKTFLQLLLVFLFTPPPPLFHFKLYKFLLTPILLRLHSLQADQIESTPNL